MSISLFYMSSFPEGRKNISLNENCFLCLCCYIFMGKSKNRRKKGMGKHLAALKQVAQ